MKCLNCEAILEQSKTKPRKFCSEKCQKVFGRSNKIVEITDKDNRQKKTDTPILEKTDKPDFSGYKAQDLYDEIATYPQDTWKDSPAYLELMKRLRKWDLGKLKGYCIPNWKKPSAYAK